MIIIPLRKVKNMLQNLKGKKSYKNLIISGFVFVGFLFIGTIVAAKMLLRLGLYLKKIFR